MIVGRLRPLAVCIAMIAGVAFTGPIAAQPDSSAHTAEITHLAMSPDGKRIVSSSIDNYMKSWDLDLRSSTVVMKGMSILRGFSYSPDGKYLAIAGKEGFRVMEAGEPAQNRKGLPTGFALPGIFWCDVDRVAVPVSERLTAYKIDGMPAGAKFDFKTTRIQAASDNARFVALGEETWCCRITKDGVLKSQTPAPVDATSVAAFDPKSNGVALACIDRKIRIVSFGESKILQTLDSPAALRCLAYVPGGDRLLSGGDDGYVRVWHIATGKEVDRFSIQAQSVTAILVLPSGDRVVTGGNDGSLRVWPLKTR